MRQASLKLFDKGDAAYYFSMISFMHVVPAILTRMKYTLVDSETVCLWLVDHSFDRAIKTLSCL